MKTPTIEDTAQKICDMYFEAGAVVSVQHFNKTKDFIATQIQQAKKEERELMVKEIEKMKFPEIDNGDKGIKYPLAQKSDPDALMQFAFNEALKQLLESIKR
jgi:hypothetical protein